MTGVTMYSTPWCGYCHRLKGQLEREGVQFEVVDIEQDPTAAEVVMRINNGNQTVPTLVYSVQTFEDITAAQQPRPSHSSPSLLAPHLVELDAAVTRRHDDAALVSRALPPLPTLAPSAASVGASRV